MANKITKREVIGMMMNEVSIKENDVYMTYLQNELALLDKKAQNKKATKTQSENVGIKEVILEVLSDGVGRTVTEIQKANSKLTELSNQKVSSLVRQLVEDKKVIREEKGKKAYFTLADTTDNEMTI